MKTTSWVRLFSRNGRDFTARFASIALAVEALPDDAVIDGEIVA
jgi:ATP-dependent DNA ligase